MATAALALRLLQWDAVENKSTVAVYGAGAIAAVWFSSTIVGAINAVPLVSIIPFADTHQPCLRRFMVLTGLLFSVRETQCFTCVASTCSCPR